MLFKKTILVNLMLLITAASAASAQTFDDIDDIDDESWRMMMSFAAGAIWTEFDKAQALSTPDEFFHYQGHNDNISEAYFDLFLGVEWSFDPLWALQLGIGYSQPDNYEIHGTFLQGPDESSAQEYAYQYDIITHQVQVDGKLLYHVEEWLHPYVFLGLGAGINESTNYETDVPKSTTTRNFVENTTTSFIYTLGVGVDVDLTDFLRLGAGYRFTDLGKSELGASTLDGTHVSGTLSQESLYSNVVLGQITLLL